MNLCGFEVGLDQPLFLIAGHVRKICTTLCIACEKSALVRRQGK